jgi:Tfp pilus assembly protein FimT
MREMIVGINLAFPVTEENGEQNIKQGGLGMKALKNRKGITLVELMVIVVIIGIIAAMAVPRFSTAISRLQFRNSARNIVSKMRLARSNAISNKQPFGVSVDPDTRTLTLFMDNQNPSMNLYENGDSVLSVDTLPSDFVYLATDFGSSAIIYRPNGSASNTGNVWFVSYTEGDAVNVGSVEILAATGRTKMGQLHYY